MLSLWKLEGVIVLGVVVSEDDDESGGGERESLRRLAEGNLGAAIVRVDMEECWCIMVIVWPSNHWSPHCHLFLLTSSIINQPRLI